MDHYYRVTRREEEGPPPYAEVRPIEAREFREEAAGLRPGLTIAVAEDARPNGGDAALRRALADSSAASLERGAVVWRYADETGAAEGWACCWERRADEA
jgi:hypothetical protein